MDEWIVSKDDSFFRRSMLTERWQKVVQQKNDCKYFD